MVLVGIIAIFLLLLSYLAYGKRVDHPAVVFIGTWAFLILLFNLQIFKTIEIDPITVAIFSLMIISFFIGCAIYERRPFAIGIGKHVLGATEYKINDKVFWILYAITVITLLYDQIEIIKSIISGNTFYDVIVSANGAQTVDISGPFRVALYIFIVEPVKVLSTPVCIAEYFTSRKKRYLILNIIIIALSVFHHGGREPLIIFAICYFLAYKISGRKIKIKRSTKIKIAILAVLGLLLITVISRSRGIEDVWLSFYAYLICSIPLTTLYLQSPLLSSSETYGMLSFEGFFSPIMQVLKSFGFSVPKAYENASAITQYKEKTFLSIGDYRSTGINSFFSCGSYMYVDGGFAFEIICMIAYGIFVSYYYRKAVGNKSSRNLAVYLLLAYALVLSFCRFYFTNYGYAVAFVYMFTFIYKKVEIEDEKI